MRLRLWLVVLISGSSLAQSAPTPSTPTAVGFWKTVDDKTGETRSIVQFTERDGRLGGSIVKLVIKPGQNPSPVCKKCNGALKDQPIVGLPLVEGLQQVGDAWDRGTIVDPDSGTVYRCRVTVSKDGATLEVRGYVGFPLLGRSQTWHRVDSIE